MKEFKKVSKGKYKQYLKEYHKKYNRELEQNCFMGWVETYDFGLSTGKYKIGTFEYVEECVIARKYIECEEESIEYYILKKW